MSVLFLSLIESVLAHLATPQVASLAAKFLIKVKPDLMTRINIPAIGIAIDVVVAELEAYAGNKPSPAATAPTMLVGTETVAIVPVAPQA